MRSRLRFVRIASLTLAFATKVFCVPPVSAQTGWQDALVQIASERSKISVCIDQLDLHGNDAQKRSGVEQYRKAKTHMDSVLDSLSRILDETSAKTDESALEKELRISIERRIAFCKSVEELIPAQGDGEKQIFQDVYNDTLKPTMDAVISVIGLRKSDKSKRSNAKTRLEAARWPDYSADKH